MTVFPTFAPTLTGADYATVLYVEPAWPAVQRLDLYSAQVVGDASLRPCLIVVPDDYTFDVNPGTRPASLTKTTHRLAWLMRQRGWNIVFASISYTDPANPSTGDGAWVAGDTGNTIPERNIAEADVLRVVQWIRDNASAYQIDTDKLFFAAVGDGATACLRAMYQDDGTVFTTGVSSQSDQSYLVAGASLLRPRGGWRNLGGFSVDLREHIDGVVSPPTIPDTLDQNLSTGRFFEGDAGIRADGRSVKCRLYFETADNWPQDYSPTVLGQIDDESAWFGEMLSRELAATSLPASNGVPDTKAFLRFRDWSAAVWTDTEKATLRAADLEADNNQAPVEDVLLDAVEDALREIRIANGYGTDVAHVSRVDDLHDEGFPSWPVILTEELDTSPSSDFNTVSHNQMRVGLYLMQAQEQRSFGSSRRISKMIADVRKALQSAFLASPGYSGAYRGLPIINSQIISWERVQGMLAETPTNGARVIVEITYRDLEQDPYQPSTALS